jgi:hypothetical protein
MQGLFLFSLKLKGDCMTNTDYMNSCFCKSVKNSLEHRINGRVNVRLADTEETYLKTSLIADIESGNFHARIVVPNYSHYLLYGYQDEMVHEILLQYRTIIDRTFFR